MTIDLIVHITGSATRILAHGNGADELLLTVVLIVLFLIFLRSTRRK